LSPVVEREPADLELADLELADLELAAAVPKDAAVVPEDAVWAPRPISIVNACGVPGGLGSTQGD
jgi:hypothetical protein